MEEPKPEFSTGAYLFPHVNREGIRFGSVALAVAMAYAVFAKGWLCLLTLPLFLLAYGVFLFFRDPERYLPEGVRPEVRVGRIMVAGETVLGHLS